MKKSRLLVAVAAAPLLTACMAQITFVEPAYQVLSPEYGEMGSVQAGGTLSAQGLFISRSHIALEGHVERRVSNSRQSQHKIKIQPQDLQHIYSDPDWEYYCARSGKASYGNPVQETFPKDPKQCIGIRINKDTGAREWVLDQSDPTARRVYTSNLGIEEIASHQVVRADPDSPTQISGDVITYTGFYDNKIYFSWASIDGEYRDQRHFIIDYASDRDMEVNIMGQRFVVIEANEAELRYRWEPKQTAEEDIFGPI